MEERIPNADQVFKYHETNSQIRGCFVPISEHFSFFFFFFLRKCFSQSGIPAMMVAISDMSGVKMGQLYFNGCHIRQPLKVVLLSIRARKDHTKKFAVKSKGQRSSCSCGVLKRFRTNLKPLHLGQGQCATHVKNSVKWRAL